MEDSIDRMAEGYLNGEIECSCPALRDLIEQTREGKLDVEEFKRILRDSSEQSLAKTI